MFKFFNKQLHKTKNNTMLNSKYNHIYIRSMAIFPGQPG